MLLALYFMFFSETLDRTIINNEYRYNLTLFKEIKRFWNMRYSYGWQVTIINLFGNVVCFMPFGFLLPTISRKKIETAQLLMKVGAFDVDDIFLNTIGGLAGYIVMKLTRLRKHI
jgi:glycopeptide antibiotics resistance protein